MKPCLFPELISWRRWSRDFWGWIFWVHGHHEITSARIPTWNLSDPAAAWGDLVVKVTVWRYHPFRNLYYCSYKLWASNILFYSLAQAAMLFSVQAANNTLQIQSSFTVWVVFAVNWQHVRRRCLSALGGLSQSVSRPHSIRLRLNTRLHHGCFLSWQSLNLPRRHRSGCDHRRITFLTPEGFNTYDSEVKASNDGLPAAI